MLSDISRIRNKVRQVLETMHGSWNVWEIVIESVKRENGNFRIEGLFSEAWLGEADVPFTIVLDENNNVVEATIEEE